MSSFEENAWVLSDIASKGNDLTKSYLVDFEHVFETQSLAQKFADAASEQGFQTEVRESYEKNTWDGTASKRMIPTCEAITSTQEYLSTLAQGFGGYADGWGFLSSTAEPL